MFKVFFVAISLVSFSVFAQLTQFPFEVKLVPTTLLDLPGLHSFASA
jgi:hypothetical protein